MSEGLAPPIAAPLGDVVTDRLELRRPRLDNLDALAEVFAKPEVWEYPFGRGLSREESAGFLNRIMAEWDELNFGRWIVVNRADQRIIGYVGLGVPRFLPEILPAVEVGWRLDPEYWGQGLASEGARRALHEGFATLELDEVTALLQPDNQRSARVCERLGMRLDRPATVPPTPQRGAIDIVIYRQSRTDWAPAPTSD